MTRDIEMDREEDEWTILSLRQKILILTSIYMGTCLLLLSLAAPTIVQSWGQILSTPTGNQTPEDISPAPEPKIFLSDELDSSNPHWYSWIGEGRTNTGTVTLRNGSALLNIAPGSGEEQSLAAIDDWHGGRGNQWLYISVSTRIRISDDNKLNSQIGGGTRFWGLAQLYEVYPTNSIAFVSYSPASGQPLPGFWAQVNIDAEVAMLTPITGVDMREWHNYTVVWRPQNATFLIDGEVVATLNQSPIVPMAILVYLSADNYYIPGYPRGRGDRTNPREEVEQNVSMEIDRLTVFMAPEQYQEYVEDVNRTLTNAAQTINEAALRGLNTTTREEAHRTAARALIEDGYLPADLHQEMIATAEVLPEYLGRLSTLFPQAKERIHDPELSERDAMILGAKYSTAIKAWEEYDYPLTATYLEQIVEWKKN